jgi:hypothetical protein
LAGEQNQFVLMASTPIERRSPMTRKTKGQSEKDRVDAKLDEALEQTFPASDPPAMTEPSAAAPAAPKRPRRRPAGKHRQPP